MSAEGSLATQIGFDWGSIAVSTKEKSTNLLASIGRKLAMASDIYIEACRELDELKGVLIGERMGEQAFFELVKSELDISPTSCKTMLSNYEFYLKNEVSLSKVKGWGKHALSLFARHNLNESDIRMAVELLPGGPVRVDDLKIAIEAIGDQRSDEMNQLRLDGQDKDRRLQESNQAIQKLNNTMTVYSRQKIALEDEVDELQKKVNSLIRSTKEEDGENQSLSNQISQKKKELERVQAQLESGKKEIFNAHQEKAMIVAVGHASVALQEKVTTALNKVANDEHRGELIGTLDLLEKFVLLAKQEVQTA